MYLKHIIIENFKGHVHCELDLKPGFNLLIGDNGMGKTSILEAVSVALGGFVAGIDDVPSKHFIKDEIRILELPMGDGSFDRQYETPVLVRCLADINGKEYEWTRRKSSVKSSRSTVETNRIKKLANKMAHDPNGILPILNYQSAARTWMQKRESSENIFTTEFNRTVGYKNCLEEASDSKTLLNWCAKMEQVEWQKGKKISEYESVKNTLSRFMSIMNEGEEVRIRFDKQNSELSYISGESSLPIRFLSAGYQSVIWMVLDIAYRMAVLNPNLRDKTSEKCPGIVLIDELDMHLHPKWQWKIIEALRQTFPEVQFIAATHSPILIASCQDGQLIRVENDKIFYDTSGYGMEINDVLRSAQGSRDMDETVKNQVDAVYELIDNGQFEQAKKEILVLESGLGTEHPEMNKLKTALAFETAIAEE